jgi:hypothetical protein
LYEHHSNELPWRESIADFVMIPEDADGRIDLEALDHELHSHADRPVKIGSFSAASNVTGILSDTRAISTMLHRHGALSFWDVAAAAPYLELEMAPQRDGDPLDYKDAIFVSPHKYIGGPGTRGVLVARRELYTNRVPSVPSGGTVEYVNPTEHVYLPDIEHREEGGTPDIVGSIRAGLVFQLKEAVGTDLIREREESFTHRDAPVGGEPEHRDPGQPRPPAPVHRLVRGPPRRPVPAPQLCGRRAERPIRDPVHGPGARARARTGTACWGSTSTPRTSSSARSPVAARGSSRAGSA